MLSAAIQHDRAAPCSSSLHQQVDWAGPLMHRLFRVREDWALMILVGLLLITALLFVASGMWLLSAVSVAFLALTAMIWHRQAKTRWCSACSAPMKMQRMTSGDRVLQQYQCATCDQTVRSGVELGWPE